MESIKGKGTPDSPRGTTWVAKWAGVLEKPLAVCYIYCSLSRKLLQEVNMTLGLTLHAPAPHVEHKPSFCLMNNRGLPLWTHTAMHGRHQPAKIEESSPAKLCCKALLPAGQAEPRYSLKDPCRINSNPAHHGLWELTMDREA